MAAVSVSMARPSRRRRSSTLSATATISGPMPSPGRTAIFTRSEQPRLLRLVLRLERVDFVRVCKREPDLVQAIEQAVFAEWLDLEAERRGAIRRGHRLLLEIDGEPEARERRGFVEEAVDLVRRQ